MEMLQKKTLKKGSVGFFSAMLKFRWLFAFLVFVCLVFFKIHFSSIECFNEYFPTSISEEEKQNYLILGETRPIRSDEWAVHTPKYLAQQYNDFALKSNRGSLKETNTLLDYYAPSLNLTLIGKPFNLGYILFGQEYGISFYFCMMEILLFMTAFEMFYILTKKNLIISAIGMLMIGFSPAMQWWLVPHITIVYIYAMGLFCLGYYFFTEKNMLKRVFYSMLAVSAMVGFCFSIFPACQIPSAFVVVFLLLFVLLRDKEKVVLKKSVILNFVVAVLLAFLVVFVFILQNRADFSCLFYTDYPGRRSVLGGDKTITDLFTNLSVLFLPFEDVTFSNSSEISSFIHFAPIFICLYGKIAKRLKEDDDKNIIVLRTILIAIIIEILFMCVGFSETLAKISLFKYVNRMKFSYEWTAVILTVFCLHIIWQKKNILQKKDVIISSFCYAAIYLTLISKEMIEYVGLGMVLLEILIFVAILFCFLASFKMCSFIGTAVVMVIAGFFVNPICKGLEPIKNHPISRFVEQTAKENRDDLWLCVGDSSYVIGNFLMANGARVLSTTHFLPDETEWKILGFKQEDYSKYNRYAHHKFFLTDKKEKIELEFPDCIKIKIKPSALKKLKIKYIAFKEEDLNIKKLEKEGIKTKKEFLQDGLNIYSLKYNF